MERNHRVVGRPLRVSGRDRHRSQLERVRPVRIGNPEFGFARTVRQEHHSAAIGCQVGSQVTSRRRDRGSRRRGGRGPRPRRVDAPHVRVGEAPHVHEPPPAPRHSRHDGRGTVLTDEWQPAWRAARRGVESPKPASGREQNLTAVGYPDGLACVEGRRQTHRIAFGILRRPSTRAGRTHRCLAWRPCERPAQRPSGEMAGSASLTGPFGWVSCRLSPVSRAIRNSASGLSAPSVSVTSRHVESGHHASEAGRKEGRRGWISATLRSGPPSGAIRHTSLLPPAGPRRRNAIVRPSGDQLGL